MKKLKITISITATLFMLFLFIEQANAQLEFVGNYADGMGGAGWNANGSGPEPFGDGHGDMFYYTASRDYLDGEDYCGGKLTDVLNGFPMFEQSLADNGYSFDQLKISFALSSLGDDIEGIDYFSVGEFHYCNFYPIVATIKLDGEPLVEAAGNYGIYIRGTNVKELESGFLKINNISGETTEEIANALMQDMGSEELQLKMIISPDYPEVLSGNGRSGAYMDVVCIFEKGLPEIPFSSSNDHEGFAGWDADGTGVEPYGNGNSGNQFYYGASLDYDSLDLDPDACLGHFLDGQKGFLNTILQLQYRGYEIGDLKLKVGLNSLGPDVEGEDWGDDWNNYYNNVITLELNNEPVVSVLCDTNVLVYNNGWSNQGSIGLVYNISENTFPDGQFVAQSFVKDLGTHFLELMSSNITYVSSFLANGRDGANYKITSGKIRAVNEQATFIPEGNVSGTWTVDNSPYYIEGPITIENNQTLTIEPGVRVATRGAYPITVKGCVKAEGTISDKVMFTASNPNITWDGMDYDGNSISSSNPSVFDHCIFQYGKAQGIEAAYNCGGIFAVINYDGLNVYNSVFRNNKADIDGYYPPSGGAIGLWNASPLFQKCIFYNNSAEYGGAIFSYSNSNPIISNCLLYENEAEKGGAIAFYDYGNGILINNTISENTGNLGGALYFYDNSNPEFINTILWNNEATSAGNQAFFSSTLCLPGFYYCDIQGGQEGFGGLTFTGDYLNNIDEDPEFLGSGDHPFALLSNTSPCFDSGTPDTSGYAQYLPDKCLCGNTRVLNEAIEIGAYEFLFVGITENSLSNNADLYVYPNPAKSQVMIHASQMRNTEVIIEVINFMGQKVMDEKGFTGADSRISLDISNLPTGTYVCKMTTSKKIYTGKLVKE